MKRRTKILFLVGCLDPGGAETHLVRLVNHLDGDRFDPVVCAFRGGPLRENFRPAVRVYSPLAASRLDPLLPFRLAAILLRERPDIVDCTGRGGVALTGRILARLTLRPRLIHSLHESGSSNPDRWVAALNRRLAPLTDCFVTVCHWQRDYLISSQRLPPDRSLVIYNGIEPDLYRAREHRESVRRELGLPTEAVAVGLVGRLVPLKAHDLLLEAVVPLVDKHPNLRLLFVGSGPHLEQVRQKASDLGLERRVLFTGQRQDVPRLLQALDILAVPSRREAFPVTVLEGMAAGLPVVASRVGGIPEAVIDEGTGLLIRPGDEQSLSRALDRVIEQPELRRKLGEAARERVTEHFSMTATVQQREKLFEALLNGNRARIGEIQVGAGGGT
jgi:glycosyltransferase involved in cell wall biosynthesis